MEEDYPVPHLKQDFTYLKSALKEPQDLVIQPTKNKLGVKFAQEIENVIEIESWKQLTQMMNFDKHRDSVTKKNKKQKKKWKEQLQARESQKSFKQNKYKINTNLYSQLSTEDSDSDSDNDESKSNSNSDSDDDENENTSKKKHNKKDKKSKKQKNKKKSKKNDNEESFPDLDQQNQEEQEQKYKIKSFKLKNFENKMEKQLEEHQDWITCMTIIQNRFLLSGSDDKTLKIWDLQDPDYKLINSIQFQNDIKSIYYDWENLILIIGFSNGEIQSIIYNKNYNSQNEENNKTEQQKLEEFLTQQITQEQNFYKIQGMHQDQINGIFKISDWQPEKDKQGQQQSKKKGKRPQKKCKTISKTKKENYIYLSYSLDGEIKLFQLKIQGLGDNQEQKNSDQQQQLHSIYTQQAKQQEDLKQNTQIQQQQQQNNNNTETKLSKKSKRKNKQKQHHKSNSLPQNLSDQPVNKEVNTNDKDNSQNNINQNEQDNSDKQQEQQQSQSIPQQEQPQEQNNQNNSTQPQKEDLIKEIVEQQQLQEIKIIDSEQKFEYEQIPNIILSGSLLFITEESFITASQDSTLRLFNQAQQTPIFSCPVQIENISCLCRINSLEERNVKQFAVGGEKQIILFEINNNYKEFTNFMNIQDAHTSFINSIVLLNNHQIFATASHDQTIKIWEYDDEDFCVNEKAQIKAHNDDILKITPFSNKLISSSADKTIKIWN